MQRILIILLVLLLIPTGSVPAVNPAVAAGEREYPCRELYEAMSLDGIVNYTAFEQAFAGYYKIGERKKNIFTLIDFTKPSTEERLYVFDVAKKKMLFKSHVSHGRNSGENYATSFSNDNGSHKSSLGFYLTGSTYQGKNGYSMLLHGLEKGINDKARERSIVVHAAAYANPSAIGPGGRLGRSFGCPALPQAVNDKIINAIKDGTVMYIYANDRTYIAQSEYVPKPIM